MADQDNPQIRAVRDSYLQSTGEDPNEMDEERRQRLEDAARKAKQQQDAQQKDDEANGIPAQVRALWERVKNGVVGTGQPLDQSITESTRRIQQRQQQRNRDSGREP